MIKKRILAIDLFHNSLILTHPLPLPVKTCLSGRQAGRGGPDSNSETEISIGNRNYQKLFANYKRGLISATIIFTTVVFCLTSFRSMPLASPSIIIYKTKKDYSKYVPVTLSADKSKVVSYPDIKDVYHDGKLAYPTALAKGYWLDNRGIGPNSAFLKLTYEDYAKLPNTPSPTELYGMILDSNPFCRIYDLGNRYSFKEPVTEINRIIENHDLKKYKRLK